MIASSDATSLGFQAFLQLTRFNVLLEYQAPASWMSAPKADLSLKSDSAAAEAKAPFKSDWAASPESVSGLFHTSTAAEQHMKSLVADLLGVMSNEEQRIVGLCFSACHELCGNLFDNLEETLMLLEEIRFQESRLPKLVHSDILVFWNLLLAPEKYHFACILHCRSGS